MMSDFPFNRSTVGWSVGRRLAVLHGIAVGGLAVLLVGVCAISFSTNVQAQSRRALLIGINTYAPPDGATSAVSRKWKDLEGAANDVDAFRAILTERFSFEDIRVLQNRDATRDAILGGITALVEASQAGDIVVFYYAGHGSQVRNTGSLEQDKLDETIVPADSWAGAQDIRDKELRDAFNALIARGANVTLIFDSCHSGSITRGLPSGRTRYIEPSPLTVNDPSDPPKPAEQGALIISASQDEEVARELVDEFGNPRGAFSWALAKALESYDPSQSADQLFQRARAILRSSGATQEPVIAGKRERQRQSFLSLDDAGTSGVTVSVLEVESDGTVVLQGGIATGLRPGATLVQYAADSVVVARLEVIEAAGMSRSVATLLEGEDLPTVGDAFEIEQWVSAAGTPLRLFLPPAGEDFETLVAWSADVAAALNKAGVVVVDDPTEEAPAVVVYWSDEGWVVSGPESAQVVLGADADAASVAEAVVATIDAAATATSDATATTTALSSTSVLSSVLVSLPPFDVFHERLANRAQAADGSVQFVDDPAAADYLLVGRCGDAAAASRDGVGCDGGVEYAWVLREATTGGSGSPAPERSDWLAATPQRLFAAAIIARDVNKLNVIWGWLHLESPPDNGSFPYTFGGFENIEDGSRRFAGDTLRVGEQYRVVLETTYAELEKARVEALTNRVEKHYLYIFIMDRSGNGYLLYPAVEYGNVENDIVLFSDLPTEVRIPSQGGPLFEVAEPVGIDSFFLISTAQPIPQPGVFNFEGVRTRGPAVGEQTDLSRLFHALGSGTRGAKQPVPTNWTIQRVTVTSTPVAR